MLIEYDTIKQYLKTMNAIVVFKKSDGSLRTMRCTLREEVLPPQTKTEATERVTNRDHVAVWDLDKSGWRSFRLDSVEDITFVTK